MKKNATQLIIVSVILFIAIPSGIFAQEQQQPNDIFWQNLKKYCGQAFEGTVIASPPNDTSFSNKNLVMHIRGCEDQVMRIPFHVGDNYSRTWVISKKDGLLQLKHDHRHEDGGEDRITQYGGVSPNVGFATAQYFPADAYTVSLLPSAASNVWWIDLVPGQHFTYNLLRLGTDRLYSIRFDLSKPLEEVPEAPWGWVD